MHGLLVRKQFAMKIRDGKKKKEYREYDAPEHCKNTPIYILSGGFKFCTVRIIKTRYMINGLWVWDIKLVKAFNPEVKYKHPNGAQKWVKDVDKIQEKLCI